MKFNFHSFVRRPCLKRLSLAIGLILAPLMVGATQTLFNCTTNVFGNPPMVDATSFFNSGFWSIASGDAYQTYNTLNYTNRGTMYNSLGWNFDYAPLPDNGGSGMAASFDNRGIIAAQDGILPNPLFLFTVSYLDISATNIVDNGGSLIGTPSGRITVTGGNVDLSFGTLTIGTLTPQCSFNNYANTNFSPDIAVYDEFWKTNGVTLNSTNLWNGSTVKSPLFTVDEPCGASNVIAPVDPLQFTNTPSIWADSITNAGPPGTNGLPSTIFNQAVFVYTGDPNISATDSFLSTGDSSNLFETITVKLTSSLGGDLFLVDMFGSSTNHTYLQNSDTLVGSGIPPGSNPYNTCDGPTYRPATFILSRTDCQTYFASGTPGSGPPGSSFFYNSKLSNVVVQAGYAAYGALVDSQAPSASGTDETNLPGQIIINAANLNLKRAAINNYGGSRVVINAANLQSGAGATISAQNLSLNIGSTSGTLNISNFSTSAFVPALHGNIYAWSAVWTNQMNVISGSGTNATTNTIEMNYNVLMVDASALSSTVPTTLEDFVLQSNAVNTAVGGTVTVMNNLFFGGQSLTLNGSLTLGGNGFSAGPFDWDRSIAPNLLYFTNNGTLSIPGAGHFGDDGPSYAAFVNNGFIQVNESQTIDSTFYEENGGFDITQTGYSASGSTGLIQNAFILSSQDISFAADTLQFLNNPVISAGAMLNFSVTGSLSDGGTGNAFSCSGFNLFVAPLTGNLSSSTITDTAATGAEYDHSWAGLDSGSTANGTSDNAAIGTLALVAQNPSDLPEFIFSGASTNSGAYALYVKTLDLSQLTDHPGDLNQTELSMIQISPHMKIYFGSVVVSSSFAAALGAQTPAGYLTATFPGQFVNDPNIQSVGGAPANIVVSGKSARPTGPFVLTWNSTAGTTYSVLKSHVLIPASNWSPIVTNYPLGGAAGGPLSYTDTTATINPAFYRVMAEPPATQ